MREPGSAGRLDRREARQVPRGRGRSLLTDHRNTTVRSGGLSAADRSGGRRDSVVVSAVPTPARRVGFLGPAQTPEAKGLVLVSPDGPKPDSGSSDGQAGNPEPGSGRPAAADLAAAGKLLTILSSGDGQPDPELLAGLDKLGKSLREGAIARNKAEKTADVSRIGSPTTQQSAPYQDNLVSLSDRQRGRQEKLPRPEEE